MKLSQLLKSLMVKSLEKYQDFEVTGITHFTEKIQPGGIFACLPGTQDHGIKFIPRALEKGARAVLTDIKEVQVPGAVKILVPEVREALAVLSAKFFDFPSTRLRMIGVTGTNGKTTTSYLIELLLAQREQKTGLIGTIQYKIGEEMLPVLATTPEAPDLQSILRQMEQQGVSCVSMEVSSHALELKRVSGCDFDIAVLTNVTEDHLDFHQTFESYLNAKGKFFSRMGNAYEKSGRPRVAVLNRDDPNFPFFYEQAGVQIVTYSIKRPAEVRAKNILIRDEGASFYVESPWGEGPINLKLTGLFNVYNVLAALTVALVEGLDFEASKKILENVHGVPGRFEKINLGQDFTVIVDYAHTPDGLENVLRTVKEFAQNKIITVFGCGGDRDRTKRAPMGEIAGFYSDFCILTTDNPRRENPYQIFREVEPGLLKVKGKEGYQVCLDRFEAITRAIQLAEAGDVVVIAGKGHEDYQIFKDSTIHFDDRETARDIIRRRLEG
ncbi:UDP-N-acetylmuramoyl-L-alanyl-D-glutamate--2,6-diaminopimelate ligase [Candidatus Contubernalis alkaliaceticus]|uniref:UDP-N-acetylmuramoyl-L-alanyl-D-glutamate--2, 6-diaminopimelate ligase n=1 Tax=Candidatus Contubernalis alkaliaceticus TaxID=338645 RepID=UPI001F4C4E50|nr:UDP-N-acetylmuramoyl-L-alanyl-D-glutamate--2,6-diaminopimelate ligase [Candidatus Contubernalis alkalaceticus]UNC92879.1 UDP-N-acetylmuramoyl-L-alanyl-D-glutamate--2,6-diaminopimelate ligase [Candidatus Contubernalis alkalaceticus]